MAGQEHSNNPICPRCDKKDCSAAKDWSEHCESDDRPSVWRCARCGVPDCRSVRECDARVGYKPETTVGTRPANPGHKMSCEARNGSDCDCGATWTKREKRLGDLVLDMSEEIFVLRDVAKWAKKIASDRCCDDPKCAFSQLYGALETLNVLDLDRRGQSE